MSLFFSVDQIKNAYFVGIGGVSMSSLALILKNKGVNVSGYDLYHSDNTELLEKNGIVIDYEHRLESLAGADTIIYTAAVTKETAPELSYAEENGIRLLTRAELLGAVTALYKYAVGISGTHGKSTTTGMLTHIFLDADSESSVIAGVKIPLINSSYKIGSSDKMVFEACEYKDSFLSMNPSLKVILNCELDHVDYFKDIDAVKNSFKKFAEIKRSKDETVTALVNADCRNTLDAVSKAKADIFDYSINGNAYFSAKNIDMSYGTGSFDLYIKGKCEIESIKLAVPGLHNVSNAVAAAAAAYLCGIGNDSIKRGLESFGGVARRFERKGIYNGAVIVDDYAHHPDEIRVTLTAAKNMNYKKIFCVFQPHTYSRTHALLTQFADALKLCDEVYLAEIYPARETNIHGISSADLAALIPQCKAVADFSHISDIIKGNLEQGDLLITMGAGEAYKVADMILEK